mmetsp:Transcript_23626/g.27741  ORF Transcript_23626/g.27741 Transcript_23626/m.27741 type:complete len:201 (-) Transcript_23626:106-708(-)
MNVALDFNLCTPELSVDVILSDQRHAIHACFCVHIIGAIFTDYAKCLFDLERHVLSILNIAMIWIILREVQFDIVHFLSDVIVCLGCFNFSVRFTDKMAKVPALMKLEIGNPRLIKTLPYDAIIQRTFCQHMARNFLDKFLCSVNFNLTMLTLNVMMLWIHIRMINSFHGNFFGDKIISSSCFTACSKQTNHIIAFFRFE